MQHMTQYVGAEFILTATRHGLSIRINDNTVRYAELFKWEEIKHLIDMYVDTDKDKQ